MNDIKGLSCILPVYNEESCIAETIKKAHGFLSTTSLNFEIIAVNDGSTDNTLPILYELSSIYNNLVIVDHENNKGYGTALINGFGISKYDLLFFTDSDMQFDFNDMNLLLPYANDFDIIVGYRLHRKDNALRLLTSFVYNRIVCITFKLKIKDINCAFKLFSKNVFKNISLSSNDYIINTELFVKSRAKGFSVKEVGVNHYPRTSGSSKVKALDIYNTLHNLILLKRSLK